MAPVEWAQLVTAWATVAIAVATIALVWATGWYLRQQNHRARVAHRVDLFLRLRDSVVNPRYLALRQRVSALLHHLESRGLTSGTLSYSPDVNQYLNNFEWVGRLVLSDHVDETFVRATYARSLLVVYPKLAEYVAMERRRREEPNLWQHVTKLYERFRESDPNGPSPEVERMMLERRANPTTRLNSGEVIDIDRLLIQSEGLHAVGAPSQIPQTAEP